MPPILTVSDIQVVAVNILRHFDTQKVKGAFVEVSSRDDLVKALQMDGAVSQHLKSSSLLPSIKLRNIAYNAQISVTPYQVFVFKECETQTGGTSCVIVLEHLTC